MPLFDAGARSTTPGTTPCTRCARSSGIPVGINVGVPGPRVRSRVQHPELLEDVMIDFPDLVVIGAHMGHPYEELLMNYMRKWPNLYLSCTAYAPRTSTRPREVHEHVGVPGSRALGQRRAVVPDAALAGRGPGPRRSTTRRWRCSSAAPPAGCSTVLVGEWGTPLCRLTLTNSLGRRPG